MTDPFYLISLRSSLLPIAFFFIFFNRNCKSKLWVIVLYTGCSYFVDMLSRYLGQDSIKNQGSLFQLSTAFTFVEGSIFGYFLFPLLKTVNNRRVMIGLYLLEIGIGIYTSIHVVNEQANVIFLVSEEMAISLLCILYFYEQVNNPQITFLYDSKEFWIILSFFFYTTSTLFLFLFTNLLPVDKRQEFWTISMVGNITKNLLFIVAFIKSPPVPIVGKLRRKP